MFRYRLRTMLIVLAIGPPVLAVIWLAISNLLGQPEVITRQPKSSSQVIVTEICARVSAGLPAYPPPTPAESNPE